MALVPRFFDRSLFPLFIRDIIRGVPVLTTSTFVSIISAYGRTILLLHSCFKSEALGSLLVSNPRKQAKHSDWCTIHHPCRFQFSEDCVHFALAGSVPSAGLWFTTVSWRVPSSSKSHTHLWLYIPNERLAQISVQKVPYPGYQLVYKQKAVGLSLRLCWKNIRLLCFLMS